MNGAVQVSGRSERVAHYVVADDQLAVGSTLGGPKVAAIIKATGAIQTVYSIDFGQTVFGTVALRHYDTVTGMHLVAEESGVFTLHPEHQEHHFQLPNDIHVHETIFVFSTEPQRGGAVDPPGVYLCVELHNQGASSRHITTYAFADLRGQTSHDVAADYDDSLGVLLAWNESQPAPVRVFGCSAHPESYETTLDAAKAVSASCPGSLSNTIQATPDPLGVLHVTHTIRAGQTARFWYLLSFGEDKREALTNYRACPPADEALRATRDHYHRALGHSVLITPNPEVNRGVLWAKANMLRCMVKSPTGWCFVNDPTRSNNSVGRDTAWFAYGCDYLNTDFARESLLAYVHNQEPDGKVVEYYDIRNGKTADYKLNINDDTPLLILALWHHYNTTGDTDFLREIYPAATKAARYILSQRNQQGLVWCTATGTSDWGIIGWRNVIENYRLSGATTEVNSECYAALQTVSHMARILEKHEASAEFLKEADDLKTAINTHLANPSNGLYYLNIDIDGHARSDVTSDLVFPVMFGVADDDTSARIISRLSDAAFWTDSGMRTTPRDAIGYSPVAGWGLLGGVWVGVSFWFAFAAARYNPEFMDHALSTSFRNFSVDPRRNSTVPGQFSEWLHGETLTNEGMMLSPWDPPRYLWAAIEGSAGLNLSDDTLTITPRLASNWKWMGISNLPYRGQSLTWFAVRSPDLTLYTNFHPHGGEAAQVYDEDITPHVAVGNNAVSVIGLRHAGKIVILAGNTSTRMVETSIAAEVPLSGSYHVRHYESLLNRWTDQGVMSVSDLKKGHVLQIEQKGFCLLELRQLV